MVNQQVLAGKWDEISGKLKKKWAKLTDDDLLHFNGNVDQLVGRIQRKTGESRESIEQFLGEAAEEGAELLETVRERVEETAEQVADGMRQGYDRFREGYAEAEEVVRARPGQSIAVAFGLGLLAGLGAAMLLRERSPYPSRIAQGRSAAEHFGRHVLDALSDIMPEALSKKTRG
jgi:uncharacterized protein YjbJ (UPF0337 family)